MINEMLSGVISKEDEELIESFFTDVNDDLIDESPSDHYIRTKWHLDGAETLEEALDMARVFVDYLQNLIDEGWELSGPIEDDYGFLVSKDEL